MVYISGAHLSLPPIQGNFFLQLQQGSWLVLITEKSLHRTPHQFNRVEVWALGRTPPPIDDVLLNKILNILASMFGVIVLNQPMAIGILFMDEWHKRG